MQDDLFIII